MLEYKELMSGFQTHMLIGAVAGLALGQALGFAGASPALGLDPAIARAFGHAGSFAAVVPLITLSALLATLPDIDEPGSYIARRAHACTTLAGAGLAACLAFAARLAPSMWVVAMLTGATLGGIAGFALLRLIRRAAGGHRRLTHSLLLALVFALAAGGLRLGRLGAWPLLPAGLAWAIVIHDLGDICTPAGVPLLYPFSRKSFRILPEPICRFGEPLAALVASLAGLLLLGLLRF